MPGPFSMVNLVNCESSKQMCFFRLDPDPQRSPGPVCALHGSQQRSSARRGTGVFPSQGQGIHAFFALDDWECLEKNDRESRGKYVLMMGMSWYPKLTAKNELRTFEQMSCCHHASTNHTSSQTLSEKVLKPSNTTTVLYTSHTSFQKLLLDQAWESNFFEGQSQSYYASLGYQSHMLHVWNIELHLGHFWGKCR